MKRSGGGELSHGYLVAGSAVTVPAVLEFLGERGVATDVNPDLYVREYRAFGIDDARGLRERAQTRPVAGERRVFVVVTPSMTVDSQNALLKVLEEPPAGAVFFFIIPSPDTILPTLRSRAQMLKLDAAEEVSPLKPEEFLKAPPAARLDMLKPLYQHEDDERDVRGAVAFLNALERLLASHPMKSGGREGIEAVYRARKYLMDKGALLKPLLEQVALLTPRL